MEIRKATKTWGTSFSWYVFRASVNDIVDKIGAPSFSNPDDYEEKVTRTWELELEDGTYFEIYDWKEYRYFCDSEAIEWHIGTRYDVPNAEEDAERVAAALNELGFNTKGGGR